MKDIKPFAINNQGSLFGQKVHQIVRVDRLAAKPTIENKSANATQATVSRLDFYFALSQPVNAQQQTTAVNNNTNLKPAENKKTSDSSEAKLDSLAAVFVKLEIDSSLLAKFKEEQINTVKDLLFLDKEAMAALNFPLGPRTKLLRFIEQENKEQQPQNSNNINSNAAKESEQLEKMKAELAAARKAQEEMQRKQQEKDAELKRLQEQTQQALSKEQKLALENELERVKVTFYDSIVNTYENLKFEVTNVEKVAATAVHASYEAVKQQVRENKQIAVTEDDLKDRWVFHSTLDEKNIPLICATTLRPSGCAKCKSGKACTDPGLCALLNEFFCLSHFTIQLFYCKVGWFGDHTKGVYVSKHPDYTFFYSNYDEPKSGDEGKVIMFKMFTGRRLKFTETKFAVQPTPGYHCHESPKHLEFFVFNPAQIVPMYVISWKAVANKRKGVQHDGQH